MFGDKKKHTRRGTASSRKTNSRPVTTCDRKTLKTGRVSERVTIRPSKKPSARKSVASMQRTRSGRGATRSGGAGVKFSIPGWFFRAVFYVGVCAFIGIKAPWGEYWNKVQHIANKPLANITIQGEFNYLSRDKIQKVVEEHMEGDFVDMDLKKIKASIERHPWVERVSLKRIWPDSMVIDVVEQKPIARWGKSGFINQYGEIIEIGENAMLAHLPVLYGAENNSREITSTYLGMAEALSGRGLMLSGIQVDSTLSWEIVLNKDFLVALGREDILERLRRFLDIYQHQMGEEKHKLKRVDMRYDSGMAVEWKSVDDQWAHSSTNVDITNNSGRVN